MPHETTIPHKIAKKDGHLHKIAQKYGCLPYLVILCQHTVVVQVTLGECWVRYVPTKYCIILGGSYRQTQIHKNITCEMYSCVCLRQCTKMKFQTVAVSAIFEFIGNEFELGENKFERERETIIFSIRQYPLNSVIIFRKHHNILERCFFQTRKHIKVGLNFSLAAGPKR